MDLTILLGVSLFINLILGMVVIGKSVKVSATKIKNKEAIKQLSDSFKRILGLAIFIVIVTTIELLIFQDNKSVGIGITTGIISGLSVLMFHKGILESSPK